MPISTQLRDRIAHDPSLILTSDDLQQLDAKFSELDVDGDGEVTRVELRRSLVDQRAAPFVTESRVDAFLRDVDLDGDGCLTFEELASATAVRRVEALLVRTEREIATLDPNADVDAEAISDAILDPLLEALGLVDAPARAAALANVERGADGRVRPEQLALAYFAAHRR